MIEYLKDLGLNEFGSWASIISLVGGILWFIGYRIYRYFYPKRRVVDGGTV